MKFKSLVIVLSLFAGFANAQKPETSLKMFGLNGKVKEVIEYGYSGGNDIDTLVHPEKTFWHFDDKGNQLDEFAYNKDGKLEFKILFDYTKDNTITESQFGADGKLQFKYAHKYDGKGKEIEYETHSKHSSEIKLNTKVIYKYDKNGRKSEEETYANGGKFVERAIFFYNEKLQNIEHDRVTYLPSGIINDKYTCVYDTVGNVIKSENFDSDGKSTDVTISSYGKVDEQGNWLFKVQETRGSFPTQKNFVFKSIVKRRITYF